MEIAQTIRGDVKNLFQNFIYEWHEDVLCELENFDWTPYENE